MKENHRSVKVAIPSQARISIPGTIQASLVCSKGEIKWTDCGITSLQEAHLRSHREFVHEGKSSVCEGGDSLSS